MEGSKYMDMLKFFLTDDTPVGLGKFKDKKDDYSKLFIEQNFQVKKQYFKPDYSNNFFLL